jgi:hypothetical protein
MFRARFYAALFWMARFWRPTTLAVAEPDAGLILRAQYSVEAVRLQADYGAILVRRADYDEGIEP